MTLAHARVALDNHNFTKLLSLQFVGNRQQITNLIIATKRSGDTSGSLDSNINSALYRLRIRTGVKNQTLTALEL
jgi:hypothetical protein